MVGAHRIRVLPAWRSRSGRARRGGATGAEPADRPSQPPGSAAAGPDPVADEQGAGPSEAEPSPPPNRHDSKLGRRRPLRRRLHNWRRGKLWMLIAATVRSCMRYRVTGLAAEAAYFGVLSLPPLAFGMAGTIGYVVGIFGDQTVDSVKSQIIDLARTALTESSVQGVIVPTLNAVFERGRADVVSIGFVLALWSGSRALNVFIDTVSIMYGMGGKRGIVKTRALSFSVYTVGLFIGVTVLPLVLAGPQLVRDALPDRVAAVADLYWPVVVTLSMLLMTSVYHFAVPIRYPWRYGLPGAVVVFGIWILGSTGLRTVLSASIGQGSTSIYGPLAAPIVVLLWLYIVAIAVLVGAALNSAVAVVWPAPEPRTPAGASQDDSNVESDGDDGSDSTGDRVLDAAAAEEGPAREQTDWSQP